MSKLLTSIAIILLVLGIFYSFAPREYRIKYGPDWLLMQEGFGDDIHFPLGAILIVVSLYVLNRQFRMVTTKRDSEPLTPSVMSEVKAESSDIHTY